MSVPNNRGHNDPTPRLLPRAPGTQPLYPPMDWKPPDFFFFLFWARTKSRVSGSTSDKHSEVGKEGKALPGPSCEGGMRIGITPALIDHKGARPRRSPVLQQALLGLGWADRVYRKSTALASSIPYQQYNHLPEPGGTLLKP